VDQAVADHLIHKNNAARKKSRLTKKLNAIG
jgi:ribosomal protein S20